MNMNLITRIESVAAIPRSKHATEDPNERRRRQLLLTYGYKTTATENKQTFSRVIQDTVEISEEGRKALARQKSNM